MSLWSKLTGELIDIIEWLDNTSDTLVYRFERHNNEIKNGAKLIVREGQAAVLVSEGKLADVFKDAGTFDLSTRNIPILSTLMGWKYGFESPFKAEVYFVNLRQFTGCKWGTMNPIMVRDPEFGPLRLRAYGTYAFKVGDPVTFLKQIVGTSGRFRADGITDQLRNFMVSRASEILAESKLPALDMAANQSELGDFVAQKIRPSFEEYGLELTTFLVENISLPPEVEKVLDQRTSMGLVGDLSKYTQFNAAQALGQPGSAAGGAMGGAMGMGAGFAMGQQMAAGMGAAVAGGGGAGAPPALMTYFVAIDGKQVGPFDSAALSRLAAEGKLTKETLVWKQGMPAWTAAAGVADFGSLFGPLPPPLPK